MIAREDQNRVVQQQPLAQRSDHQPKLVVDQRALGMERPPHRGQPVPGHLRPRVPDPLERRRKVIVPVPPDRGAHLPPGIHREIRGQGDDGRMREIERQMPERRPRRIAPLDHPAHLPGLPDGRVMFLRQMPGPELVAVVRHPVRVALSGQPVVGQPEIPVVGPAELRPALLVRHHLLEADAVTRRIDVQLSDRPRLVSCVAENLGQMRQGGTRQRRLKHPVAVVARVGSRHQAAPRGDADRTFGMRVGEADAVAGDLIEGRRVDVLAPRDPEERSRPLVGRHQKNVRSGHRRLMDKKVAWGRTPGITSHQKTANKYIRPRTRTGG